MYAKGAERRREIISATLTTISDGGIEAATTRRIAATAGVQPGIIHHFFANKDELLVEAFQWGAVEGIVQIGRDVSPGMGLHDAVPVVVRALADWNLAFPAIQRAQMELILWCLRRPDLKHISARVYRLYIDGCATVFQQAARPSDRGVDVDELSRRVIAWLDGHILQYLTFNDDSLERLVNLDIEALQQQIAISQQKS